MSISDTINALRTSNKHNNDSIFFQHLNYMQPIGANSSKIISMPLHLICKLANCRSMHVHCWSMCWAYWKMRFFCYLNYFFFFFFCFDSNQAEAFCYHSNQFAFLFFFVLLLVNTENTAFRFTKTAKAEKKCEHKWTKWNLSSIR